MNTYRKFGGGYCKNSTYLPYRGRRQGTLTCLQRLPEGGQRWDNISDKGGVVNG